MPRLAAFPSRSIPSVACALASLLLVHPQNGVLAQQDPAPAPATTTLEGRVVSSRTGQPLADVQVVLKGWRLGAITDSAGQFRIPDLPAGEDTLEVGRLGYESSTVALELRPGATTTVTLLLGPTAVRVAELRVEIEDGRERDVRLPGFERRRLRGQGHFITPEEVEWRNAQQPTDLLRNVPGVEVTRSVLGRATVRVARSGHPGECDPTLYVDGQPTRDLQFDDLNVDDILAVEVYRGASEYPLEFANRRARCGLIVVWTRGGEAPPE